MNRRIASGVLMIFAMNTFLFGESRNQLKVGQALPIPESGFEDEAKLKEWAVSSSFGGGRVDLVAPDVYCVVRSVTSGRPSAEVIIFVKKGESYRAELIVPSKQYECKISVKDDVLKLKYLMRGMDVEFLSLAVGALRD